VSPYESWIRADLLCHRNVRNYYVDRRYISSIGLGRHDDNFVPKLEELLKKRAGVPADAYCVGWWYEPHKAGITLRFVHKSFPEAKLGELVEQVECNWTEKVQSEVLRKDGE